MCKLTRRDCIGIDAGQGLSLELFKVLHGDLRITLLRGGKLVLPTAWEGDPPGGHHRKGIVRFDPIKPAPEALELRVQRPGEKAPRVFRWRLK